VGPTHSAGLGPFFSRGPRARHLPRSLPPRRSRLRRRQPGLARPQSSAVLAWYNVPDDVNQAPTEIYELLAPTTETGTVITSADILTSPSYAGGLHQQWGYRLEFPRRTDRAPRRHDWLRLHAHQPHIDHSERVGRADRAAGAAWPAPTNGVWVTTLATHLAILEFPDRGGTPGSASARLRAFP